MAKLSLLDFGSSYQSYQNLNSNNASIEAALENTLSRDGTSPNQMQAALDMNSNRILNLPAPSYATDPVRLSDIVLNGITVTVNATDSFSQPAVSINTAPPGSPAVGDRYLVAHSATTGVFVGHEDKLAVYTATGWTYLSPSVGQNLFVTSNSSWYTWSNSLWTKFLTVLKPGDNVQTAFTNASGGDLLVVGGTYTSVGVTVPSNTRILSSGRVIFQTTSTTVPILDFTNSSGCILSGNFKLQGNGPTLTGYPFSNGSNTGQVGIKTYNTVGLEVSGFIEICNIAGYGIDEHAPASAFTTPGNNQFRGLRVHDCYFGAYVRDFSEYSNYTDCWFYKNIAAIKDESGNRGYYNCHIIYNTYGFFLDGSVETGNNAHGIVSGCFINHNVTNITCDSTTLGELFTGCQILADGTGSGHGLITIINGAKLINFVGCDIGSDVNIDATSKANFVGNTVRAALTTRTVAAGGVCNGTNMNFKDDGSVWF